MKTSTSLLLVFVCLSALFLIDLRHEYLEAKGLDSSRPQIFPNWHIWSEYTKVEGVCEIGVYNG